MEKKNTMLLTVIAVATLLVAVVGATFAYFSVTGNASSSTAAITATTEDVGTVSLTPGTEAMTIDTVAGDFANTAAARTDKWANAAEGFSGTEVKSLRYTAQSDVSSDAIYRCSFNIDLTVTGVPANNTAEQGATPNGLVTGDYLVYLHLGNGDGSLANTQDVANMAADATVSTTRKTTKTVTLFLTGNTAKTVYISAKLVNTANVQNYLRNLNSSITAPLVDGTWSCDTVTTAGTDTIADAA